MRRQDAENSASISYNKTRLTNDSMAKMKIEYLSDTKSVDGKPQSKASKRRRRSLLFSKLQLYEPQQPQQQAQITKIS